MEIRRRLGLGATLALISALNVAAAPPSAMPTYFGGYKSAAHGWAGKRRKLKGWQKETGRRSKAQRRARAA